MQPVSDTISKDMPHRPPAIDHDKALEILDGDIELYDRLVEMLVDRVEENYASILRSIDDQVTLERLAHNLKGITANMAAEPLRQVCEELETRARAGDFAAFRQLLPLLRECITELVEFARQKDVPSAACR
jgi:HPt (histidine-containing phosphotransfer) domain-containing protein